MTDSGEDGLDIRERLGPLVERFLTPRPGVASRRDLDFLSEGESFTLGNGLVASAWGDGPTVLLAHGWESRRSHWGPMVAALNRGGFRALAVDAPAHGDSPGDKTHVVDYGRRLVEVGREVGPLAGVVGHSFGAGATLLAVRSGLEAGRVVLLSGFASVSTISERWGRHHGMTDLEIPVFLQMMEEVVGVPIDQLDLARIAAGLDRPALVIHDRGDEDIPVEDGIAIGEAWPGATLLLTERYGHRRILMAKDVLRELVGFLQVEGG